jgi:hypothetical protein
MGWACSLDKENVKAYRMLAEKVSKSGYSENG